MNCVTEELKDPVRNMPRAIILSITTVTLIYIVTNTAYFAVLSKAEILESDAIAVVFGEKAFSFASWLMPLLVALSTMGGLHGSVFTSSRIIFAGARQGHLMSVLHMLNLDHLTPVPSLLFLGLVSALYLSTTEILVLINYSTLIEALFSAMAVSTVLTLRIKFPDLKRPLRIYTFVPVLYLIFSLLFIVLPIRESPLGASIGILILAIGVPVYYATARWKNKPEMYQNVINLFNTITQKITWSVAPTSETEQNLATAEMN